MRPPTERRLSHGEATRCNQSAPSGRESTAESTSASRPLTTTPTMWSVPTPDDDEEEETHR
jgi:hypothetical protein